MAETKKAKSIDTVAINPVPDTSSRPLIVRSGPIMRDPSIIDQGNTDETMPNSEQGMISQAKTIKITPVEKEETKLEPSAELVIAPLSSPALDDEQTEPSVLPIETNITKEEEKPALEATKEAEPQPEVPAPKAREEEVLVTDTPSDAALKKQELKREEADKEHLKKLDQLVESERYFLPINMREKRQNQRFVLIGVLICVLLAIVWYDVTLDAGLISNVLHLPHTHFFVASS